MISEEELGRLLSPTATVSERARALQILVPAQMLADAFGLRESSVRNWIAGQSQPRRHAAILLDDLRATAKVLFDGGLEPERISAWLTSRHPGKWDGLRPVEAVSHDPMDVLAAAHGAIIERQREEVDVPSGGRRPRRERALTLVSRPSAPSRRRSG